MDKLTCVRKVWTNIWHPHRCGKPAKFFYDGLHSAVPLCGIHARSATREGKSVKPISAHSANEGKP